MEELQGQKIIPVEIVDEMEKSYLDYSMSVIVGRALPDVRDGQPLPIYHTLHTRSPQASNHKWRPLEI